jgi:hypothetical protein
MPTSVYKNKLQLYKMNALTLPPIPVNVLPSRRFVLSVEYGTSFQLISVLDAPVSTKKLILKTDSGCLEITNAGT